MTGLAATAAIEAKLLAYEEDLARHPFDPAGLNPLWIQGEPLGRCGAALTDWLLSRGACVRVAGGIELVVPATASLQEVLGHWVAVLAEEGRIPGWRGEAFALLNGAGAELARVERAAFRVLGFQSQAVHINGFDSGGTLWIGRRSPTKPTDPGRLDNLAAGGLPAGEAVIDCARRELWEEAGVPGQLSGALVDTGTVIHSLRREPEGVHDERLYVFDLCLPDDFEPCCQDGEVAAFYRMDALAAATALAGGEFAGDAGRVTAAWIRRQLLRP